MSEKTKQRILFSILISLLVHLGFLIWSFFVQVIPYGYSVARPEKLLHVKIAREESVGEDITSPAISAPEKTLQTDNPFTDAKTLEPLTKSPEEVKDNVDSAVRHTSEPPTLSSIKETGSLKEPQLSDVTITKKVKRSTRKNLIEEGDIPQADFTSGAPVIISGEDISKDYLDKSELAMNASPLSPIETQGNSANEFQVMKKSGSGISRKSNAADLGTALTYELSKYQDPKSGQKYFKLVIKVRDAMIDFPVIPKEIIFLVDASASIGSGRLSQFEDGVAYSLKHLNTYDHFNIIIFKEKTIPLSPASLTPDAANVKKAVSFLRDLKSGSRTDVYNALKTSITLENPFVPSYRVFLSDGFPTKGMVNSRQVINEISRINNARVSIFAFGGGVDVSRYMMDFLAYKNRGWSQFTGREYLIGRELSRMYDRIKDPLLLDLRYHINGLNDKEVFPKTMPDFFKGSEFVIYGTYTNEDKFYVQVLGNVSVETKAFIVSASLNEASAGNKEIARQWAFHKIYHLIGQLKYNEDNQALIKEIDELSTKFEIVTPYSSSVREGSPKPKEPAKPKEPPKVKEEPKPKPAAAAAPVPKQNFK